MMHFDDERDAEEQKKLCENIAVALIKDRKKLIKTGRVGKNKKYRLFSMYITPAERDEIHSVLKLLAPNLRWGVLTLVRYFREHAVESGKFVNFRQYVPEAEIENPQDLQKWKKNYADECKKRGKIQG